MIVAILIALRMLPAAIALPVLGGPLAPWSARVALAAMAAVALALVQPAEVQRAADALPLFAIAALGAKELAVGAVLAAIASAPLYAADTAGRWIGDAIGNGAGRATGLVTSLVAVIVFFAIDGHLIVIGALASSYDAVPLLDGVSTATLETRTLGAIVAMLGAAVALAAPALVAGALVEIAIGLVTRAGGRAIAGVNALRGAAVIAFVAAGLTFFAGALARDEARAVHAMTLR